MTFEEQMRIIHNWTFRFGIGRPSGGDGMWSAVIRTSPATLVCSSLGPYRSEEQLVQVCYEHVRDKVWRIVGECG